MYKTFLYDGYIYTQCIKKGGKLMCRPNGGYYRFPAYTKKVDKKILPPEKVEALPV